jgi:O-antigen ligase
LPVIGGLILLYCLLLFSSLAFGSEIFKNSNYDKSRLANAHLTLNIIEKNPVNGIGYGQFRIKYVDYFDQDIFDLGVQSLNDLYSTHAPSISDQELSQKGYYRKMELMTHNDILTIVAELGMIGVAILFYILFKLFNALKLLLSYNREYFYISISLIIPSFIFSLFHNNLTSFIFWFIIFLPFIINRNYLIEQ